MNPQNLIKEIYSTGARLEINGPDIIIERKGGPLADSLMDELRLHKAQVMAALNVQATTGGQDRAPGYSEIIPGEESYQRNFIGERVSFLLKGSVEDCLATPGTVFAEGTILSQKWLGYTASGNIPEYEVQVKTDNGQVFVRRLVEDYVSKIR